MKLIYGGCKPQFYYFVSFNKIVKATSVYFLRLFSFLLYYRNFCKYEIWFWDHYVVSDNN